MTDVLAVGWHATHTNPSKHNMKYSLVILYYFPLISQMCTELFIGDNLCNPWAELNHL